MKFLKTYKIEILIFSAILAIYFFSRLYNIMSLPLFVDEAIYVRWSQIARYDAAWRFISLTDGKQPSFVWIAMNIMRFVNDPLLAGRLVSVIAGFFSIIGLFFLGREIFKNKWVGLICSALYLIFPMPLVYDRMALYDSLVGTFAVWSLYLEILLIRNLRLDIALLLGMIMGGATLTKTSGFFSIYLLPFSLLLFDLKQKNKLNNFLKWIGLSLISVILAYGFYSVLRLSPFFHIINDKNAIFVYPFKEWLEHPWEFFLGNLHGVWDWFITYYTWPFLLFIIISFFISLKYIREKTLLVIWFLLPFVALALFGKVLYPRFIFFMTLSLIPLVAFSFYKISVLMKNKIAFAVLFLAFSFLPLRADYFVLTNFAISPIPKSDLGQYINNWPAGGGVKEVISFLGEKASKGKIYVATDGTFGSLPTYAVEIYLGDNKNVDKRGIWPLPQDIPKDLIEKSKKMPVYFVANQSTVPSVWPLKFIAKYRKGVGDSYMTLYQVVPQ
ncbi:MAG: glycosyltransferase family 39 protein [Patescibacteria group bacterium]|nr:glycosyltransferase family 39 protein [Patescibacteria group bacterium]